MDAIEKIRMIFFEPSVFFRSVKNEKRYLPILMYFAVAYILSSFVSLIFELRDIKSGALGQFAGLIFVLVALFMLFFVVIIAFAAPFIGAGISHLGIMIVGGAGKYFDTFKASTYASVLSPLYAIILGIIGYFNPFNLNAPIWTDLWNFYSFLWIAVAIASTVHILYIECVGLSMYHKISKIRALAAILLIPIAMLVILGIFILIIALILF